MHEFLEDTFNPQPWDALSAYPQLWSVGAVWKSRLSIARYFICEKKTWKWTCCWFSIWAIHLKIQSTGWGRCTVLSGHWVCNVSCVGLVIPLRGPRTGRALELFGERTVGESGAYRGDGVKMEMEPGGRQNCCSVRVKAKGWWHTASALLMCVHFPFLPTMPDWKE